MASDLPEWPFPTAPRPLSPRWPTEDCKSSPVGLAGHLAWPGPVAPSCTAQGDACPCGGPPPSFSWRVLLSSAEPRDSPPGHTELTGSRCAPSLRLHASPMTSVAWPPTRLPAPCSLPCRPSSREPAAPCSFKQQGPGQPQPGGTSPSPLERRSHRPRENSEQERCQQQGQVPCCSSRCKSSVSWGTCRSLLGAR